MKNNNVFIHKITGEKLTIKKVIGNVATCECEKESVIIEKPYLATKTAICSLDNLIAVENEKTNN